ncbi:MAG: nucleotide exchange factor GrpE [Chloroflexi bacterium]|nr:nucleotide exchange factor GrpE [Chloroflexota bacterium]
MPADEENAEAEGPPPAATPAEEDPQDVEGLRAKLQEEREKAQGHLSSWQRAAADFQNFKRRVESERAESGRLATAALVMNLLPLVDDIERALKTLDPKLAGLTWIDGIWLIYRKFQAVLENAGVKEIEADGLQFDPNVHEAVSEAPGEEGKVVSVVQKGYSLGERVVRPAMVVVGKKADGEEKEGEGAEEGAEEAEEEGEKPASGDRGEDTESSD